MRRPGQAVTMKMLLAVVMMVVVTVVGVAGRPQEDPQNQQERNTNPVFNIWEFAISNDKYNPKRDLQTPREPCTWAIVTCCLAPTREARDTCFDENGCPGAWFNDLCSDHFKGLARNAVHDAFSGGF